MVSLKSELHYVLKNSSESIDQYIHRTKDLKDRFANVSVLVDSEYLFIFSLNGLPSEYSTFKTSMKTRSLSVSFHELHVLLVHEEVVLNKQLRHD